MKKKKEKKKRQTYEKKEQEHEQRDEGRRNLINRSLFPLFFFLSFSIPLNPGHHRQYHRLLHLFSFFKFSFCYYQGHGSLRPTFFSMCLTVAWGRRLAVCAGRGAAGRATGAGALVCCLAASCKAKQTLISARAQTALLIPHTCSRSWRWRRSSFSRSSFSFLRTAASSGKRSAKQREQ